MNAFDAYLSVGGRGKTEESGTYTQISKTLFFAGRSRMYIFSAAYLSAGGRRRIEESG